MSRTSRRKLIIVHAYSLQHSPFGRIVRPMLVLDKATRFALMKLGDLRVLGN